MSYYSHRRPVFATLCGCWCIIPNHTGKLYLPQVQLESQTTILATTSRTILRQTFINPLNDTLKEVSYTFPLYDGVSVAGFQCTIADRVIVGLVKERNQARTDYQEAIAKGETAGLLEQNVDAADVFTTSIGNIPAGEEIVIEITYLGELKNDAETDGARFTIPTQIAPRYGSMTLTNNTAPQVTNRGGMKITVDVVLEEGSSIRGIQSPSHPIAVTMGRTSEQMDDDDQFENNLGSSTLALGSTELDKDFIIVIQAKGQDTPRALLETHPTLPNHRALMTTLVPKFNIPNEHPEIVFVVDRSGSMSGKMHLVKEALTVFLKSLPVGSRFDICSFGSHHSFLFSRSKNYDASSLQSAMDHVQSSQFQANYGGTEMLQPIKEVLKRRYKDLPLEVMLLTDGEIWDQNALFATVNEASQTNARFFTVGIGSSASSSLVEGVARAGRGFSQWVNDGERIDKKIVRMLKGALTPHIKYKLEVKYTRPESSDEEDFEIIESFEKSMRLIGNGDGSESPKKSSTMEKTKKVISLFSPNSKDEPTNPAAGRYDHLPKVATPNVLQTPHVIPELYPHSRSTIYLLLGPGAPNAKPSSVILRGTSEHGDLELEIQVQDVGPGTTIHKLAAKKAMQELEEGRGWLTEAQAKNGKTLKSENEGRFDMMVERESVRLGTTFQVGGKFCSFVAVEKNKTTMKDNDAKMEDESELPSYHQSQTMEDSTADFKLAGAVKSKRRSSSRFAGASAPGGAPSQPSLFGRSSAAAAFGGPPAPAKKMSSSPRGGGLFGSNATTGSASPFSAFSATPPSSMPQPSAALQSVSTGGLFGAGQAAVPPPPPSSMMPASAPFQSSALSYGGSQTFQQQQQQYQSQAGMGLQQNQVSSQSSLFSIGKSTPNRLHFSTYNIPQGRADSRCSSVAKNCDDDAWECCDESIDLHENNANISLLQESSESDDVWVKEDVTNANMELSGGVRKGPMSRAMGLFSRREAKPEKEERKRESNISADRGDKIGGLLSKVNSKSAPLDREAEAKVSLEKMQKLISLQTFSGSWKLSSDLPGIITQGGVLTRLIDSKEGIVKFCKKSWVDVLSEDTIDDLSDEVFATSIAIAWLEFIMIDEEDVWEMVVGKAKGWLESKVDGSDVAEKMVEKLKSLWKSRI